MNRSQSVADATRAIFRAAFDGDGDAFEGALLRSPDFVGIGTDPDEWWSGFDAMQPVLRRQLEEAGGSLPLVADDVEAYEQGDVGWSATRGHIEMPGMPQSGLRVTCVFVRDGDGWKVAQFHLSFGVTNEDALGVELTT